VLQARNSIIKLSVTYPKHNILYTYYLSIKKKKEINYIKKQWNVYFCDRYYIVNNNVIINNLLIYLSTTMNTLTRELKVSSHIFFHYCCTHITRHIIRDTYVATWCFPMIDGYINLFFVDFFSLIFSSVSNRSVFGDRRRRQR
jgi:hypothetical protein